MMQLELTLSRSAMRWQRSTISRGDYAAQRRIALVAVLAPDARCACCRRWFGHAALEIDHVDGCTWNKRAVNAWRRVARYWRELADGVRLRALCRGCNGSDGQRFRRRAS